jgi:hypothetical protein
MKGSNPRQQGIRLTEPATANPFGTRDARIVDMNNSAPGCGITFLDQPRLRRHDELDARLKMTKDQMHIRQYKAKIIELPSTQNAKNNIIIRLK